MIYTSPTSAYESDFLFFKIITLSRSSWFCDFHCLRFADGTIHYRVLAEDYVVSNQSKLRFDFATVGNDRVFMIAYEGNPVGTLIRRVYEELVGFLTANEVIPNGI